MSPLPARVYIVELPRMGNMRATRLSSVTRLGALTCTWVLAVSCGGGSSPDLPPLQASSTHFRYHASSLDLVAAGILDGLEANRSEMYTFFGLQGDDVIDYYRFDDLDALNRTGLCGGDGSYCADGRRVMTDFPFHQHELIHAYLAGLGRRPHLLEEGVATAVSCGSSGASGGGGGAVVGEWRDLFRVAGDRGDDFYGTSAAIVRYLIVTYGAPRFIDYYAHARAGQDADAFATEFESYWSVSIDDVWADAHVTTAPVPLVCPCGAQPMAASPDVQRFVHDYNGDYRTLGVQPGGGMSLTALPPTGSAIYLNDCAQVLDAVQLVDTGMRSTFVLLDDRPRYLTFSGAVEDHLLLDASAPLNVQCQAARAISLSDDTGGLSVLLPRGGSPAYVKASVTTPTNLTRSRNQPEGALRVCSDCTLSDCRPLTFLPTTTPIADGAVLEFDPGKLDGAGLTAFVFSTEAP